MRSDVTYCAVRRPPAPPLHPGAPFSTVTLDSAGGRSLLGGAWPPSVSPSRCRLLSRDRPLPAGGASIRCHGDGVRLPFPIGQGVRGAGPRSVTRETASLAPVLALPLAAAAPVPAGGALPMAAALEAALGTACCWGLSPALDLHQHRELRLPARFPPPPPPPRSIFPGNTDFFFPGNPGFSPVPHAGNGDATALLVGAAEGRHLLLTASRAHREPRCAITVRLPDGGGRLPALHGRSPR